MKECCGGPSGSRSRSQSPTREVIPECAIVIKSPINGPIWVIWVFTQIFYMDRLTFDKNKN